MATEERTEKGRCEMSFYNPTLVEPPEPDYEFTVECQHCGAELHEGNIVYERKGKIIACELCIDDLAVYVEDL